MDFSEDSSNQFGIVYLLNAPRSGPTIHSQQRCNLLHSSDQIRHSLGRNGLRNHHDNPIDANVVHRYAKQPSIIL